MLFHDRDLVALAQGRFLLLKFALVTGLRSYLQLFSCQVIFSELLLGFNGGCMEVDLVLICGG